ncbi:MAG: hypothetical protein LIO96_07865, partial [Lachnospiraceae bacterium]|nr:hypothetical protein [Lachnospiraceae bacterium]
MFLRTSTFKSTENSLWQIEQLQNLPPAASFACYGKLKATLDEADAVIIGAGAGLSTSAGFVYNGEQFRKYFSDYEAKYGFWQMTAKNSKATYACINRGEALCPHEIERQSICMDA